MNFSILLIRLSVGAFMLFGHGVPKAMKLLEGNFDFPDPLGIGSFWSLILAVFAECICSICFALGFFTRLATIPLIITMVVAAFIVHAGDSFRERELALMYLVPYITIFILGSGKYALKMPNVFRKLPFNNGAVNWLLEAS